jgi:hypothetical protein
MQHFDFSRLNSPRRRRNRRPQTEEVMMGFLR